MCHSPFPASQPPNQTRSFCSQTDASESAIKAFPATLAILFNTHPFSYHFTDHYTPVGNASSIVFVDLA